MTTTVLPPAEEGTPDSREAAAPRAGVSGMLSGPLQEVTEQYPYVLDYIQTLPVAEVGVPKYVAEPSRKLGDDKEPNSDVWT